MTRNRRAAPGRTAVGYFMPFSECRRRQPRGPGAAAEAAASEPTEVSRQAYDDCDGSGHGYYEITYSDGSVRYEEY